MVIFPTICGYHLALRSYRLKFCIYYKERDTLIADAEFIAAFRRCVVLVCLSWGWDLLSDAPVERPHSLQIWHGWDIRLRKVRGRDVRPSVGFDRGNHTKKR